MGACTCISYILVPFCSPLSYLFKDMCFYSFWLKIWQTAEFVIYVMFNFPKTTKLFFKMILQFYYSPSSMHMRDLVSYLWQHLVFSVIKILTILLGIYCLLVEILIIFSWWLMMLGVFPCVYLPPTYLFKKCLFAYFKIAFLAITL